MASAPRGLRGTGKSTIVPMLAEARQAVLVPTVPPVFQPLRHEVDERRNVEARMCFYLSALFTAADEIRRHLTAGVPVVVESYFARCLANHRALGAGLGITLPAALPQPVTYHLVCAEDERHRRLASRVKPVSHWDALVETVTDRVTDAYTPFPMHRVDTTDLSPDEVLQAIVATDTQGAHSRADTETEVTDLHAMADILRRLGLTEVRYQENYREEWRLGEVAFDFDTWPDLPTFVEIEGPDEESVRQAAALLQLDYAEARFGSVDEIYKSEAGRDILSEPTLLFADAEKQETPAATARSH